MTTYLLQQLGAGRQILIASARYDDRLVSAVAQHLGLSHALPAAQDEGNSIFDPLAVPSNYGERYDYLGAAATQPPLGAARVELPAAALDATGFPGWRVWIRLLRPSSQALYGQG